jgi:DNA topoisomerase III
VAGHITEKDFDDAYRGWRSCDPGVLFDATIYTRIPKDKVKIRDNLSSQASGCQMLVIWTDCDREGEAIGAEVAHICRQSNSRITVKRARFSAIIAQYVPRILERFGYNLNRQIHHAAQNLSELDMAQVDAVEARTVLDLRIGAAFTRLQTLALQDHFPALDNHLTSYGGYYELL